MKLKGMIHQLEKCRFFSCNLITSNGLYNHFLIKHQKWLTGFMQVVKNTLRQVIWKCVNLFKLHFIILFVIIYIIIYKFYL